MTLGTQSIRARCVMWALAAAMPLTASAAIAKDFNATHFDSYVVRAVKPDGLSMAEPALPDITGFTKQAALNKIVRRHPGEITLTRMVDLIEFDEFVGSDGRLATWAERQRQNPVAIVLQDGLFRLSDVLGKVEPYHLEATESGIYTLRLPLLITASATLLIDGSVRSLRLSQQAGAFLVNDGRLFVADSEIVAWDEAAGKAAGYQSKKKFRPFMISWGGSETYLIDSQFKHLGYGATKSYGISFSQYSKSVERHKTRSRPTGWIVGSTFDGLLYGFYCYEADDVAIVGNVYKDSIIYGIDPHDRSLRLIIAENTAFGTRERHGIIVSREVNDSWIFRNESYDNHGSGIMVDRQSTGNIVAYNKVHGNGSDGITIYESPENLLYANQSIGNQAHGYRVRNSVGVKLYENRAIANAYTGINGHVRTLNDPTRDLALDPYDTRISMVVVGGRLIHNGGGPISIDQPVSVELYDVDMFAPANATGVEMSGVLGEHLPEVLDVMIRQRQAVVIEPDNIQRRVDG
ncbi:MAG: right-handed parallel beta-helix repeat-containing protein [Abyssibacter sp.]|nr:NosD domain-containing protein [Abyssibacter sp.]MCK5858990.1 right-handed parallel beta-helix repeat-containing protein [Abyssibacter sp.]